MQVHTKAGLLVAALALGVAGCSSAASDNASQKVPSPTNASAEGSTSQPLTSTTGKDPLLTAQDIGLAAVTDYPDHPEIVLGRLYDRAEAVNRYASLEDLRRWNHDSDHPAARISESKMLSQGRDTAEELADLDFGTADPLGCWSDPPPAIEKTGSVAFGGEAESVTESVSRYSDAAEATSAFRTALDPEPHLNDGWENLVFVYTSGDQQAENLSSNRRCGAQSPDGYTACATVSECEIGPYEANGSKGFSAIARRGPWIVQVATTGSQDTEKVLTTALGKLPG